MQSPVVATQMLRNVSNNRKSSLLLGGKIHNFHTERKIIVKICENHFNFVETKMLQHWLSVQKVLLGVLGHVSVVRTLETVNSALLPSRDVINN